MKTIGAKSDQKTIKMEKKEAKREKWVWPRLGGTMALAVRLATGRVPSELLAVRVASCQGHSVFWPPAGLVAKSPSIEFGQFFSLLLFLFYPHLNPISKAIFVTLF